MPLDVIVLDKSGNPVRGLTKDDFVVEEDRKPQNVSVVRHGSMEGDRVCPPKIPAFPTNTYVDLPTAPEQGPLYVLYYDMVNTPLTHTDECA